MIKNLYLCVPLLPTKHYLVSIKSKAKNEIAKKNLFISYLNKKYYVFLSLARRYNTHNAQQQQQQQLFIIVSISKEKHPMKESLLITFVWVHMKKSSLYYAICTVVVHIPLSACTLCITEQIEELFCAYCLS